MNIPDECIETRNDRLIVTEEEKRKLVIDNPAMKTVRRIAVDRCVFKGDSTSKRCDYILEISVPLQSVFYLELKGSKIDHGIEQLAVTLGHFRERHGDATKKCILVASKVPSLSADTQARKDRFYRTHRVEIEIKRLQHRVTI
ncbi:MAG: hypothetical protein JNK74_17995 [Candidatus Hydrogenedentes bacterium]|nr:hypothetical protein [Candidatus Hydrogenedentota bacterium]